MRLSGSGFGFLWGVPVLSGLFTLVTAVILARVGGRLLGIRMRWRRAILAGFAGLVLGWTAAWSISGQRRGPQTLSWPAVLFGALIATMLIAVLLDLLARPGRLAAAESRLHARPVPHPIRSLRQRAERTRRYLQVTRIAARHGLSSYLTGRRPGAEQPRPLERARLASELHDVVTHNVSMMVVQAGAARQVLSADPGEATRALRAVESSGRTAMTELRHLLGLLSPPPGTADAGEPAGPPAAPPDAASNPGGTADLAPQPGLEELREMVGRVVTAGLPVELRITGTPRDLPPGLGLAMYRVVQEALTNVIKHAGKPRTEVRLNYEPAALVVEVADDGRPIPAAGPAPDAGVPRGAGMGLLGLRERVALYGGELSAGPRPGGGWLVKARIPVEPAEIPAEVSPP
jgi:signal transduction histidine kinase